MLNISNERVNRFIDRKHFSALDKVEGLTSKKVFLRLVAILFVVFTIVMFLPWTQNINAGGYVTTLSPDQRPQTIHAVIAGQVQQWFVQEGDFVSKGDTVLHISEIKADYLDPELIGRTEDQLFAKENSVNSYQGKVISLDNQIQALEQTRQLKLEQTRNKLRQAQLKVQSDSIKFEAAKINVEIAKERLARFDTLYKNGLKSLTELEGRKLIFQKTQAEVISQENELLTSKNEVINAQVEITSIDAQYRDKITKAESDKYAALSSQYDAEALVNKLKNELTNYSIRNGMYYITAPQNGYITKAIKTGIGETIKEGEALVSIMPANYQLAVEMYVNPIDLPLLQKDQEVRVQFDGWPAIVFSGWPNSSIGTFGGKVFAIDNFTSQNGKYRILVRADPDEEPWPEGLRIGAGSRSMVLLKNVPVWYELWRQINGFPPDFYMNEQTAKAD